MEVLSLVFVFLIIGLILSAAWYLLPFLIVFWIVLAVIRYFQTRRLRKQLQKEYGSLFENLSSANSFFNFANGFSQSSDQKAAVRKPREDSIDVDYVEYQDGNLIEEHYEDRT